MRVLHVQKVSGIGGSERHLLDLLPRLVGKGIEVEMITLQGSSHTNFDEQLSKAGVPVHQIRTRGHLDPFLIEKLRREIHRSRVDLMHTHLVHADVYGQRAAKMAGCRAVNTLHSSHSFFARFPISSAWSRAVRWASRSIAVSTHVARFVELHSLIDAGKITIIPHGVDLARWATNVGRRQAVRRELGIADDVFLVGVASRLFPNKGHAWLLDAFAQIARLRPVHLAIAGEGPIRTELEDHAGQLLPREAFTFLGHVTDVPSLMASLDVVVVPSLPAFGEGFGLTTLEAMAASRPVVVSDIPPLNDLVSHEQTGFSVPPGDVSRLARTLLTLQAHPQVGRAVGSAARKHVARNYSIDHTVNKTIRVYEDVLGQL